MKRPKWFYKIFHLREDIRKNVGPSSRRLQADTVVADYADTPINYFTGKQKTND